EEYQLDTSDDVSSLWVAPDGTAWVATTTGSEGSDGTRTRVVTLAPGDGVPSPAPGNAPEWVIGSMQTEGQPARMLAGTSANDVWLVRSDEISEFWHWDGLTWTLYPGH